MRSLLLFALFFCALGQSAVNAPSAYTGKGGGVTEGADLLSTGESDGLVLTADGAGGVAWESVAGTGDVVGPSSSVDAEIALFNSTTGKLIKRASGTGLCKATSGVASFATLVNADVSASAAIAYSKLAALTDGNILVGSASNVATSVDPSGDIDVSNAGVFSIASGVIVNADVNASAAIAYSKLAALTDGNILVGSAGNVATSVDPSGDIDVSNAGVFSIAAGVIVNADVNASAAIALSKLSLTGLVEDIHGYVDTVADGTKTIIAKNRVARQVTKIYAACASGSVTIALKIGGTNVTTCNAVSISTGTDTTCDTGSTNDLASGGRLTLTWSSNSSCTGFEWSIETTRD